MIRIGISSRIMYENTVNEKRDALSHDWYPFLKEALPEADWMILPNLGNDIISYIQDWKLSGFILTGGNDIGAEPARDTTENTLIEYALSRNLPLFGVCRGLQLLYTYFGGRLVNCPGNHEQKRHIVAVNKQIMGEWGNEIYEVNSFHKFGITAETLTEKMYPFAQSSDSLVEGLLIPETRIIAVMWHPEREKPYSRYDITLIRRCFI